MSSSKAVIGTLNSIVQDWAKQVAIKQQDFIEQADEERAMIFTFGGYARAATHFTIKWHRQSAASSSSCCCATPSDAGC